MSINDFKMQLVDRHRFFTLLFFCSICALISFHGLADADERLIFMADENYRPYEFKDNQGQVQGFNIDVFRAVAGVMALDTQVRTGEWHNIRTALETGKIDGLTGMYHSQSRDRKVDFSNPFLTVRHSIFIRQNTQSINSLDDIRGKGIAVQRGDIMHDYALKNGLTSNLILAEDQVQALQFLSSGKCDCALLAKLQGLYNLNRLGIQNVKAVGSPFSPREYCFAVQEGNQKLLSILNEGLAIIQSTDRYDQIYNKWFGEVAPKTVPLSKIVHYAALILGPLLIIFLSILLWTITLRKRVKDKTASLQEELTKRQKAEKDLRESESKFRLLAENSADFIWTMDIKHNITYISPSVEHLFGYPPEEYLQLAMEQRFTPESCKKIRQQIALRRQNWEQGIQDTATNRMELVHYTKGGNKTWVELVSNPIIDDHGQLNGIVGITRDISQRKETEEALLETKERLNFALEATHTGLWDWNIQTAEVIFNEQWAAIAGYTLDELKPLSIQTWVDLCHAQDLEHSNRLLQKHFTGETDLYEDEARMRHKNGGWIWILDRGKVIQWDEDGQPLRMIGTHTDITSRKKFENALQESENRYRILFEKSPVSLWEQDFSQVKDSVQKLKAKGIEDIVSYLHDNLEEADALASQVRILNVNQATLDLYQAQSKEDFFQGLPLIFEEEALKDFIDDLAIIFSEKTYFKTEIPQRTIHGQPIHIQLHWSKIPGYEQSLEKVLVAVVDITELKRTEEMLLKTQSRLEEAQQIAQVSDWEWDPESNQVTWSKYMYQILGVDPSLPPPDYEGQLQLYHPDDARKLHEAVTAALNHGRAYELELSRTKPDGTEIIVLARGLVKQDQKGKVTKLYGSVQDITQQKKDEQDLLTAKRQADEANRAKSEFLANMSHEIRTPINGISGMLQLLQTTAMDEEQQEYVDMAQKSTLRLNRLLTDILDLSKIEADKLEIKEEEFKLNEVLQSLKDIFTQVNIQNNNSLSIELDDKVPNKLFGDSTRLTQILFNLVGNASKYTEKGHIDVQAWPLPALKKRTCRILFTINDNGVGIADNKLNQVFESFKQATDTSSPYTRHYEGAGLGLPLVKRLVQLMDGNMSISSQEGQGTTVHVSLPFKLAQSLEPSRTDSIAEQKRPAADNSKILLVDDEETTQKYIKRLLEKYGYKVVVAENGEKALAELEKNNFDCVLMDIQMPVLDGVEATKKIRGSEYNLQELPVIALTAYAMLGDKEKFLEAGMDDYLAKPVHKESLLEVLNKHIYST